MWLLLLAAVVRFFVLFDFVWCVCVSNTFGVLSGFCAQWLCLVQSAAFSQPFAQACTLLCLEIVLMTHFDCKAHSSMVCTFEVVYDISIPVENLLFRLLSRWWCRWVFPMRNSGIGGMGPLNTPGGSEQYQGHMTCVPHLFILVLGAIPPIRAQECLR